MKDITLSPQLAPLVEQMSRDMAVPVDGLVNQAVFNWARLHGYLEATPLRDEAKEATRPPTPAYVPKSRTEPKLDPVKVEEAPAPSHLSNEPMPSLGKPAAKGPTPVVPHAEPVTAPETHAVPEPREDELNLDMTAPSMRRMPRVVLIVNDREVPVTADRFVVGRDVSCHLTIDAPRISRQHAAFVVHPDGVRLEDLNSSNGTWFDGQRIGEQELAHGDEIFLGDVLVRIQIR